MAADLGHLDYTPISLLSLVLLLWHPSLQSQIGLTLENFWVDQKLYVMYAGMQWECCRLGWRKVFGHSRNWEAWLH